MGKRIILKGGSLPPPKSSSGIEIGGKTLEELLGEVEAKELGEQLVPDNVLPYHKSRARYAEEKGKREPTRILTRREINAENWEKIMENQKTIEGIIAALLLSGREVTGREIQENCVRRLGISKKMYSQRSTYLYHKTDFGKFIESRRDGKGASYKLVSAALECRPEELVHFVYKGNAKARETILEHHKGLQPYLEDKPKELAEEQKLPKVKEKTLPSGTSIKPILPSSVGVNIVVSGQVEVVFRFIK